LVASIIKFFIFNLFFLNSYAEDINKKYQHNEKGIISIMYHRFNENKYPSTNIQMDIFKKHIEIIKNNNLKFYNPNIFEKEFNLAKSEKKILITIDDAFLSFYENAWPYLKKNKIPFILFVSTEPIGKKGYMTWDQLKEIEKENFAFIGNHSHSHEYLIKYKFEDFKDDINKSINIFKKNIGYNPKFFSYPFGEFSLEQKNYIAKNFKFAFGQHSGVIDLNKDKFELPRFPINEKYGDLIRFEKLVRFLPLQYKNIYPKDKLLKFSNNPPEMYIEFFTEQKNLSKISCYSNEGEGWDKTKIKLEKNKLNIFFDEKFKDRRGRINCSLNDKEGWRWLGIQFTINN
tara:strand:+ start:1135 stop:2166 length:1032 start_codon:yes stop_codon:yes gene_type:complete